MEHSPTESAALCIPEDVIVEIFKRLPVKSLIRFKCLNRDWRDLISSSDFAILHFDLNKHKQPLTSYLRVSETQMQLFTNGKHAVYFPRTFQEPDNLESPFEYLVGSSANGLVCLRGGYNSSPLTIWNPATGYFTSIERSNKYFNGVKLFGFDVRPCGDYRVVVILVSNRTITQVHIKTRSNNCWKIISNQLEEEDIIPGGGDDVVTLDGCMYLQAIINRKHFRAGMASRYKLTCFDMWEEKYRHVNLPNSISIQYKVKLGVVNGSLLGIFTVQVNGGTCTLDGWVMNGEDGSWTKRYSLIPVKPQQFVESMSIEEGDTITYDRELHYYHNATKTFCSFSNLVSPLGVVEYKMSLFSVHNPTM